jgi:hypothetical protein
VADPLFRSAQAAKFAPLRDFASTFAAFHKKITCPFSKMVAKNQGRR